MKKNMIIRKNIMLLFAISILSISVLTAQPTGFRYGTRLGLGQSTIRSDGVSNLKEKLLVAGGLTANYQILNFIGINGDVMAIFKGAQAEGVETVKDFFENEKSYKYNTKYDLIYAELPLMLKLSKGIGNVYFKIFAGPGINFKLAAMETREYADEEYQAQHGYFNRNIEDTEVISYSANYGAGIDILMPQKNEIFFLDVRKSDGLTPFGKLNGKDAISDYIVVCIGFQF